MIEIKGTIVEVIYHNEENTYTIAVIENETDQFTAVGYLPVADRGRSFTFTGDWTVHKTYGEQFAFTEYKEELPETEEGIVDFLASGIIKGIGPKTALLIVKRFGHETLDIIQKYPHKLAEIDGIGAKKAEIIAEAFRLHREFAEVTLYFHQYNINAAYAMKLYKVYGSETIDKVKENPYRLVNDVFGIGFKKADQIAEKMGIARDSEYRIASGAKYLLTLSVNDGHTYLPKEVLISHTAELLDVARQAVDEVVTYEILNGEMNVEVLEGRQVIYLAPYYLAEKKICKGILALMDGEPKSIYSDIEELINITERETGIVLANEQKTAVHGATGNSICVITGGPGTGKTTIINTIIKVFEHSELKVAIAAPTGRAAKRITETSGLAASTIHRLLEYSYSEDETNMSFGRNSENPLEYDVVIIDESSMIDLLLMNALLSAVKTGTRLILVGDADQLPSVGAGNVLRDILDSELVPAYHLMEIFRQAKESMIVVNAHRINKGEYPHCNGIETDFFFMEKKNEANTLETIKNLCVKRLPDYYKEFNGVGDIQVLTPVRKGLLGTNSLNQVLQQAMNPNAPTKNEKEINGKIFRVGDKVMQIKNNYQMTWKRMDDFSEGEGIFNGDIGFIRSIDNENGILTVVFEDIKHVEYEFAQTNEIELAYAVTVHKSQGSEFPIVVMPVSYFPPMLSTRNLLYTAVTRAAKVVVLVGVENRMHMMIENNRIKERYSGLKARLQAFINNDSLLSAGEVEPFLYEEELFSEDEDFLS